MDAKLMELNPNVTPPWRSSKVQELLVKFIKKKVAASPLLFAFNPQIYILSKVS